MEDDKPSVALNPYLTQPKPAETKPITDEQFRERLRWLSTAEKGTFPPDWLPIDGWDVAIREIAAKAMSEIESLEALFELRRSADHRAIAIWRRALPDRELRLPDHADLCVWLLNKLEPQWMPIAEAPVPSREVLKFARWHCLLQNKRGSVVLGWAAYARKPGSRVIAYRVQWYDGAGKVFEPIYWMPAPLPRMDTEEKP